MLDSKALEEMSRLPVVGQKHQHTQEEHDAAVAEAVAQQHRAVGVSLALKAIELTNHDARSGEQGDVIDKIREKAFQLIADELARYS